MAAKQELERRQLRGQYLPCDLQSDMAWAILLDVFVSDQLGQAVPLVECGARWDTSDATALRHAAALVAANLVERHGGESSNDLGALQMSSRGRETLTLILKHYP